MNAYELQVWQMTVDEVKALIETNRQQTDRIAELEKDLALKIRDRDVFCDFTLAYEKRIEELEKDLHMVQRHYDQLNLPDGYVFVCIHCAKEIGITLEDVAEVIEDKKEDDNEAEIRSQG